MTVRCKPVYPPLFQSGGIIKSQSNPIYTTQLISGESSQRYPYANLFPLFVIKDPSRSFWTLLEMEPTRTYSCIPALIKNIPSVL